MIYTTVTKVLASLAPSIRVASRISPGMPSENWEMILTCITAAMAGYALAKKRFMGRALLFSLIVCAMALPKQVILIPLASMTNCMK